MKFITKIMETLWSLLELSTKYYSGTSTGERSYVVLITPKIAKELIKNYNPRNRKIRDEIVNEYAEKMLSHLFLCNGDTIVFDWNGALIDGQHRLLAIIKTGISMECFVIVNVDPAAMSSKDAGKKRTGTDTVERLSKELKISLQSASVIANAIGIMHKKYNKELWKPSNTALSPVDTESYFERLLPAIMEVDVNKIKNKFKRQCVYKSIVAVQIFLLTDFPDKKKEVLDFFNELCELKDTKKFSYILNLHNFLNSLETDVSKRVHAIVFSNLEEEFERYLQEEYTKGDFDIESTNEEKKLCFDIDSKVTNITISIH